ncbi:DUF4232 domain-containing protein [Streptomyces sp. LN549]|uniref:DUF4232 domain-containing protein n=1 Tax=Streptomyces sp. LN549 TaxID=3112979 RepID=UPI003717DF90
MRSNRIRTTALAATALLAALSLTACSSDDGNSDSTKAGSAAPAAHTAVKQSPSPASAPDRNTTDADTGTDTGTGSTPKNPAPPTKTNGKTDGKNTTGSTNRAGSTTNRTPVTCDSKNTRTGVTTVSRPVNHLLLTLTNTGGRPCYAYYAPKLQFDDAQAVFPILDDSRPQAVVTLDPGQSAYAAIGLTGEPGAGPAPRKATHLQVHFSGRSPEGSTGTPAELTLPSDTYWDDNGFVTYWQTEMADALSY